MQIILEFDTPKVDLFTAPFLVEMIRVQDQLMKGFFEKVLQSGVSFIPGFLSRRGKADEAGHIASRSVPAAFPLVNRPFSRVN